MEQPLRILHLEDDPADAELIGSLLQADGVDCVITHVADGPAYRAALARESFDLVLSDFSMPSFDGREALVELRRVDADIPLIYVSGTIGEEAAVESLLAGAADYILKNNPRRLASAVRRAAEAVGARRRQKRTEAALQLSEAKLRQAQKMEAVGRLAGGVAHDFNNVLTVIQSCAVFLDENVAGDKEAEEDIKLIRQAADRAAALTRQLLAFSRRQAQDLIIMDLNKLIANMESILRRLAGEHIAFKVAAAEDLGLVRADQAQLEQILLNLVVNARDAMPDGGRLAVATANVRLDAGEAARRGVDIPPGEYVELTVADSGTGMSEAALERAFEPFFTTKEPGKGTGLGLSTVYGIVKQSGGYVWLDGALGRGTTVTVQLPLVDGLATVPEPPAVTAATVGGSETILLAENDEMVRRPLARFLKCKGYTVLAAGDGEEALRAAERHAGEIHLLLTDVVMPNMGGGRLAEELAARRPGLRVLYMSAYPDNAISRNGAIEPSINYLQKPYQPDRLLARLRSILEASPGAKA